MLPAAMTASLILAAMDLAEAAFRSPDVTKAVRDARRSYEDMRRELKEKVDQGAEITPEEYAYWTQVIDRQIERQIQELRGE